MKFKTDPAKETEKRRKERVELSGATRTKVVPDKTKYTRKEKYTEKFESFLDSFKGNGQDTLIETIQAGYRVCFEGNITIYRGMSAYNKNGNYFTTDREWARQFTQSGKDSEIITASIPKDKILRLDPLPQATNEEDFDKALKMANERGYSAVYFDEGINEPNSIYVINKAILT
jgi:hypothetical protein